MLHLYFFVLFAFSVVQIAFCSGVIRDSFHITTLKTLTQPTRFIVPEHSHG